MIVVQIDFRTVAHTVNSCIAFGPSDLGIDGVVHLLFNLSHRGVSCGLLKCTKEKTPIRGFCYKLL